jgi:hypothetical protein
MKTNAYAIGKLRGLVPGEGKPEIDKNLEETETGKGFLE